MSKKEQKKTSTKKESTKQKTSVKGKTAKPKAKPNDYKKEVSKAEGIDDSLLIEGIDYIEQNKLDTALEVFDEFTDKFPKSHYGWYYIGYTKMLQSKKKDALKNFKKVIKMNEQFLPARYYMGLIEFENNNWSGALQIFDQIMESFNSDEIKESNFNIPYFIAICHHYLGNLQRAEEYFLFAYNLSPEDPVVLYYKGFNELALQNYDFAIETFKNLLYIDINNDKFWDLFKGYSYFFHQNEHQENTQ